MIYHDGLKTLWKGSKSMVGHCNNQNDHNCPPITFAPQHPTHFNLIYKGELGSRLDQSRTINSSDNNVKNVLLVWPVLN